MLKSKPHMHEFKKHDGQNVGGNKPYNDCYWVHHLILNSHT